LFENVTRENSLSYIEQIKPKKFGKNYEEYITYVEVASPEVASEQEVLLAQQEVLAGQAAAAVAGQTGRHHHQQLPLHCLINVKDTMIN
jgi:hypothetical protein